jgi:putative transposase
MGRLARIVVPGFPHHLTQRGNRRAQVFDDDKARELYLTLVARYAQEHGVAVWAYCLMANHVHFVVVPRAADSLARCFRGAHTCFSQWVNEQRHETGSLWQSRFFSCALDEIHQWAAVRYVERNPVRAGLVRCAADYPWSSAAAHCGQKRDQVLADGLPSHGQVSDWPEWLSAEDAAQSDLVRRQTRVGRPCGSASFFDRVEALLLRTVRPQKRGRKPKLQKAEMGGLS